MHLQSVYVSHHLFFTMYPDLVRGLVPNLFISSGFVDSYRRRPRRRERERDYNGTYIIIRSCDEYNGCSPDFGDHWSIGTERKSLYMEE